MSGDDDLPALVRTLIPQIGDDTLAMGVAGVARFAAERQAVLDGVAARIAGHTAQDDAPSAPDVQHVQDALEAGPDDAMLGNGLSGLWLGRYSERLGASRLDGDKRPFDQLRALHRALHAEPIADVPDGRTHIGGPELPKSQVAWDRLLGGCAAVALRAASPATPPREREALRRLLVLVNALGLDSSRPGHWRQVGLHLAPEIVTEAIGQSKWADYTSGMCALLPLADGAFLAVLDARDGTFTVGTKARLEYGCDFTALFHDPSGRFEVPAPYTVTSSVPVGEDREPGWLGAFLSAWAEHGQITRQDAAAEEFAELTGAVPALAGLLLAGLPELQDDAFPSSELRGLLEIKQSAALVARGDIARHAGRRPPRRGDRGAAPRGPRPAVDARPGRGGGGPGVERHRGTEAADTRGSAQRGGQGRRPVALVGLREGLGGDRLDPGAGRAVREPPPDQGSELAHPGRTGPPGPPGPRRVHRGGAGRDHRGGDLAGAPAARRRPAAGLAARRAGADPGPAGRPRHAAGAGTAVRPGPSGPPPACPTRPAAPPTPPRPARPTWNGSAPARAGSATARSSSPTRNGRPIRSSGRRCWTRPATTRTCP